MKLNFSAGRGCRLAVIVLFSLVFPRVPGFGQEPGFEISGTVDWVRGEYNTEAAFSLAEAGVKLPAGRFLGEEILREAYPRLLRPFVLALRVDSATLLRNLWERRELTLEALDGLSRDSGSPPNLSPDLKKMAKRHSLPLEKISALLMTHTQPSAPRRPLLPARAADYTGIIVIASRELPVHGRKIPALAEPCLFPKIWDTNMDLVYERNMFEPGRTEKRPDGSFSEINRIACYAVEEDILRPTPSGLEGELALLLGPNPLRVFARELFGAAPTDMVIDRDDALLILSTENNRRLLREGRVALILDEKTLRQGFAP